MNITEFAEQVVFGKTLAEKLLDPGDLSVQPDHSSAPDVSSLLQPGRPDGLEMLHGHIDVKPPSDGQLDKEQARGQLLHFLANHELLATELMGLVLLKFPDAPKAFRQGILATLKEEQEHTRLYIRRMKECGVEFGCFPLSGHFWRMIEPMQSPMDFVSRLSLTFEQANLDYSFHYATVFQKLGDERTAKILQKIYRDEIGHVRHGLHWFRKWKDPHQSDWEAYQSAMVFPMSPQRALGPSGTFNRDGRNQAGLSDEFIDSIEVFRQSRGRPPTILWFDPAAEAELSGGPTPRERAIMEQLGLDLELVIVALAKQDDVILVRQLPSREYRKRLIEYGLDLPQFMLLDDSAALGKRKLHDFSPWAWTPINHSIAEPLASMAHVKPDSWSDQTTELYRKSWSARRLESWLDASQKTGELPGWFGSIDCTGVPVYGESDVVVGLEQLARQGYTSAIFKCDLAASGRQQRRFSCHDGLSNHDHNWLRSVLGRDSSIANSVGCESTNQTQDAESTLQSPRGIIEPELDRQLDISFLWHLSSGETTAKYLGWTRAMVSQGRRYVGTRLGSAMDNCNPALKRFVLADHCKRLQTVVDWLQPRIVGELVERGHSGYFGVDAMVFQDLSGNLKLKPIVELNPRTTMGHVALALKKRLAPGAEAEFRVFTRPEWIAVEADLGSIPLTKTVDGRLNSGVLWLGEFDNQTRLFPALVVGSDAIDLLRTLGTPVGMENKNDR